MKTLMTARLTVDEEEEEDEEDAQCPHGGKFENYSNLYMIMIENKQK